jgi:chaperonin GroEL
LLAPFSIPKFVSAIATCTRDPRAGQDPGEEHYAYGFDAQTGEFNDLVTKGIVDPTKVVRTALQDAASIAGLLITTEAMVAKRPKRDAGPAGQSHPPHGGHIDF